MRKIIAREMISLDGFFAGMHGETDWHRVDAEFNLDSERFLETVDTLMFGRVTYDLMASYWPMPEQVADDPVIAEKMNSLPKIVFSETIGKADWNNSKISMEINAEEIQQMKESPGKDIAIFGSGMIVSALTDLGLIDEYRFIVNPVILGEGKLLFASATTIPEFSLIKTKEFSSGNVSLNYKLGKKKMKFDMSLE